MTCAVGLDGDENKSRRQQSLALSESPSICLFLCTKDVQKRNCCRGSSCSDAVYYYYSCHTIEHPEDYFSRQLKSKFAFTRKSLCFVRRVRQVEQPNF
jgi:hypothetical protein